MMRRAFFIVILILGCGQPPQEKAREILRAGIADQSMIVRINAAKGLKRIGDPQGTTILYEMIRGDDHNGVVAALDVLYELGESTLSPLVIELSASKDPLVRTEAYRLISIMTDKNARPILKKGVDDEIAKIRRLSYLGLAKFREKEIIWDGLRDVDGLTRIAAARSLVQLGVQGMPVFIKKELQVKNIDIWQEGIIALAEISDTSSVGFIRGLLVDTPWDVRITAAEALLILGRKDGVEALSEGLRSPDPFTRIAAVKVLKDHDVPELYDLLRGVVDDEYINVSVGALEALIKYYGPECRDIFLGHMDAPNPLVRIVAATGYLLNEPGSQVEKP